MIYVIAVFFAFRVSREGEVTLLPNLSLPGLFQLSYLANTLTATFLIESIIGNGVCLYCCIVMSFILLFLLVYIK